MMGAPLFVIKGPWGWGTVRWSRQYARRTLGMGLTCKGVMGTQGESEMVDRTVQPVRIPDPASGQPRVLPQDSDGMAQTRPITPGGNKPIQAPSQGDKSPGPRGKGEDGVE